MDFEELMKQAGEVKQRQMKDKRRAWESTAEFVKNTIAHDASEEYAKVRASKSVKEKIEFAAAAKAEGNALFAEAQYTKAMLKYTQAVAVFRYWVRKTVGKDQELLCFKDDETLAGDEQREARAFLASVYLNAAACMLKLLKLRMRTSADEVVWTCSEVIEMDAENAKAYYRRAMAYVEMDSSASLELAVRDLTKASKFAPQDAVVRAALQKHKTELEAQNVKDKKTYGGMFQSRDGLYTEEERAKMRAPAGPSDPSPAETLFPDGLSDAELKRRALAHGLDLDDPKVMKKLEARARERHDDALRAKAKELDIDLDDPDIRRALELLDEEEQRRAAGVAPLKPVPAWRRFLSRAFDKSQTVNVQNLLYAYLAVRPAVHPTERCPRFPFGICDFA
jgi:tetratricopeptide (TPR) repeat protein